MIIQKLVSIGGIVFIFLLVWLLSERKRDFPWRIVIWGLALQLIAAVFILYVPVGVTIFKWLGDQVTQFLNYSKEGAHLVFGDLAKDENVDKFGLQIGIIIAATVIFFSAIVSVLYHYGIMQRLVYGAAFLMQKTMGTSGIESLSASGNIFIGQTEAPLMVRHYLGDASRSELNSIMTGGFATIAGGVMSAYIAMGIDASILITASLISAPGGLMLSKVLIPPEGEGRSVKDIFEVKTGDTKNLLDALTSGAGTGMKLSLNIIAMLIAFVAIIAFLDAILGQVHAWLLPIGITWFPESLNQLFGFIFQPFAYLLSIPSEEARAFGSLLGTKISINEFIAYTELMKMIESGAISERTMKLATFALCGFANFGSIAIQIGGLGAMAPERRSEFASLGLRAMFIGALVNMLTATIASLFI